MGAYGASEDGVAADTGTATPDDGGEPGASRRALRRSGPIAALDIGTNNCRLLVAQPKGGTFTVLDAFSRAVRLGEGMEGTGRLSDVAMERALKALRICAGKIRHHRVREIRAVATEACRRAENGPDFIARVARETGLEIEIISPEAEARFAVAGCAPLIDRRSHQVLVFDIGGGSTELIWIDVSDTAPERRTALVRALAPMQGAGPMPEAARVTDWISVPAGVSTLHDRFEHIAEDRARFDAMSAFFEERLADFVPYDSPAHMSLGKRLQIIGVSGTATTFGALYLGLKSYDRSKVDGLWLPTRRAEEVAGRLLGMGTEPRAEHPGIGRGRADLVVSGAAILMTILRCWPVKRLRIADRGLREGMLYGLIQQRRLGL